MSDIFISYRRGAASPYARGIYERLEQQFGADRVFMDIDTMEPGVDFVDYIKTAVTSCRVLLVVITPDWVSVVDGTGQRRLENPEDFVRVEVTAALERENVRVIPVLVGDAPPPTKADLPAELGPLTRRQALQVSDARWDYDLSVLARTITRVFADEERSRQDADAGPLEPPKAVPQQLERGPGGQREETVPHPRDQEAAVEPARGREHSAKVSGSRRPLLVGGAALILLAVVLFALLGGEEESTEPGEDGALSLTRDEIETALKDFEQAFEKRDAAELDGQLASDARYTYLGGNERSFAYDQLFDDITPVNVSFRAEADPELSGSSGSVRIRYRYVDTSAPVTPGWECAEGRIQEGTARVTVKQLGNSTAKSDVRITEIADRPYLSWEAEPGKPPRKQSFIVVYKDRLRLSSRRSRAITDQHRCPVIPLRNVEGVRLEGAPVRVHGQVLYANDETPSRWPGPTTTTPRNLPRGIG